MSIYPVRLSEWFPKGDENHETMKFLVSRGHCDGAFGCLHCGKKKMHWQKAWGHHSLPWGYGDIWCSERHFEKWRKKEFLRRAKKLK